MIGATSCLRVPGTGPVIFFLPGNPGLCEFYSGLAANITKLLPEAEVIVPSHLGFTLGIESHKVWTLDDEVNNAVYLARSMADGRPLYLFGHSVGAWIAQRAAMAVKPAGVGLVTPTVMGMPASPKGRILVRLSTIGCLPWLCWGLATILGWLPTSLLNWALSSHFGAYTSVMLDVLRQPSIVYQVIAMGQEEMERIVPTDPPDLTGFWHSSTPVWGIFAKSDPWIPSSAKSVLTSRCTSSSVVDIRHSFVLSEDDTRIVADWISELVMEDVNAKSENLYLQ